MKPSSLLLRLLLSACLVLNGIGSAVASGQMSGGATMMPAATAANADARQNAVAPEPSQGACHEDAAAAAPDASAGSGHGEHGTECCQAGMCACECMHQEKFAFALPVLAACQVAHTASVRAMGSAHEAPSLPHLIRPPICQAN